MFKTLVVDDEPKARELASAALERCDLACDTAGDGDEALAMYEAAAKGPQPYQAVVTDLRMPRRHGHSLAVELLNRPSPPSMLVVTGLADPGLIRDLMSRGVEDVVHKPVNYDVLAMKVLALATKAERNQRLAAPNIAPADEAGQQLNLIEKSLAELTDMFSDSLAGLFEFDKELNDTPKAVSDFIVRFGLMEDESTPQEVIDARQNERIRTKSIVVAIPVTRRFSATDEPFRVPIRDLSMGGIRLLHTRATNSPFLALKWQAETIPGKTLTVVAKVTRCQPLSPFYDIGGEFVTSD